MDATALCFTPTTELAKAIRARQLSPVEIIDTVLARIEALNPHLNAFLAVDAERAHAREQQAEAAVMRGEAWGLLHGLPVSIKDLEPSAGLRCTYGSKFFEHYIADVDGIVTERVKAAGGIVIGKTNTPHYGHDMCDNLLGPPCRNPWKLERTSGGSSGGAAEMIEAGLHLSAVQHGLALLERTTFYEQVRRFFERYDLLLTPQMPVGAWHAVIGPNGAGKTTFVSQIAGMLRPDAGCIRFAGVIRSDVQGFTCRSKVWYAGRTYGHDSG